MPINAYLHLVLTHDKNEKRVELFSSGSLQWLRLLRGVGHYPFVALAAMHSGVTCPAQRDQIFLCVGS